MSHPTTDDGRGAGTTRDGADTIESPTDHQRSVPRPALPTAAGAVALVPVAAATVLRVARNAPVALPGVVRDLAPQVGTLAAVVPALALVAVGLASERRGDRVALLAAGVFPALATVTDALWYAAAAALVVGGGAAVASQIRDRGAPPNLAAVAALALAGLTCATLGSAGVARTTLGPVGATLAFGTLAALPVARSLELPGLGLWVGATLVAAGLVASAPFVAGAVVLVAFGAGTAPFLVLALGLGGGVAVALAAAWRRRWGVAVGASLLLVAGAPSSLASATAVVLALVALVTGWGPTDRVPAPAPADGGGARA